MFHNSPFILFDIETEFVGAGVVSIFEYGTSLYPHVGINMDNFTEQYKKAVP